MNGFANKLLSAVMVLRLLKAVQGAPGDSSQQSADDDLEPLPLSSPVLEPHKWDPEVIQYLQSSDFFSESSICKFSLFFN